MTVIQAARPYWKAVVGFIAPGAVLIGAAVLETSQGGTVITQAEWVTAVAACVITSTAVFAKKNGD